MTDEELAGKVRAVLAGLALDGTGVEVVGVDQGIVQVRLTGTCTGCPSSVRAVIMDLEDELTRRVPGVRYLETV